MSEDQRRALNLGKKMARRATPKKAAAPLQAPADQPTGVKAPPPKGKGQESPEAKVSHPMVTRTRKASRAGGLRGVVGSGSNEDTCVASGNPSSKPGS
jgi:hypothetical protein